MMIIGVAVIGLGNGICIASAPHTLLPTYVWCTWIGFKEPLIAVDIQSGACSSLFLVKDEEVCFRARCLQWICFLLLLYLATTITDNCKQPIASLYTEAKN